MSQGNSHPELVTTPVFGESHTDPETGIAAPTCADIDVEWANAVRSAVEHIEQLETINADSGQRGTSWALPVDPSEQSRVPIWSGRAEWLRQLRHQVTSTDDGRTALARERITVDTLMAIANAHARFADTRTGRGVTASKARIAEHAGVSDSTLKRCRRVLKALSMGVEHARGRTLSNLEFHAAEAHHGGAQHKAASTWSLSSPKTVVMSTPPIKRPSRTRRPRTATPTAARARTAQRTASALGENPRPQSRGPLSLSGSFVVFSSVGSSHQRARRARTKTISAHSPRPIELQRAAASLAANAPAFNAGHIGAIADVIRSAGIDTARWTGRDIARALSRHTAETGQIWPTASEINSPAAFLRFKLSQLSWTGQSPSEVREQADATRLREIAIRKAEHARRDAAAASTTNRAAARAAFAQHMAHRQPVWT